MRSTLSLVSLLSLAAAAAAVALAAGCSARSSNGSLLVDGAVMDGGVAEAGPRDGARDTTPVDPEAAEADFLRCDGEPLTVDEAAARKGSADIERIGAFKLRHRMRTCEAPGSCSEWADTKEPTPLLGVIQGTEVFPHGVGASWIAELRTVSAAPAFSFGITLEPDPLGVKGAIWATIECRLEPPGSCDLVTNGRDPKQSLSLGPRQWTPTRLRSERLAPSWRLGATSPGDSVHVTSSCARLRLVASFPGDDGTEEEHALVFAGTFSL